MGRPLEENKFLVQVRNDLIHDLKDEGLNQSDIARVFRLPRNTVSVVIRRGRRPLVSGDVQEKDNLSTRGRAVYYRNYRRKRYQADIQYKLSTVLRSRIAGVLKNNRKAGSAVRDLGCTPDGLKKYIEEQFVDGMSWENWSQVGWHIDHIRPLSSFDLTDRKQFLQACHYTNLRPLWAKENLTKGKKII